MNDEPRPPIADLLADHQLIAEALGRGVREALMQHAQAGQSVAIWRDGKVTWVPAEEIVAPLGAEQPSEPEQVSGGDAKDGAPGSPALLSERTTPDHERQVGEGPAG